MDEATNAPFISTGCCIAGGGPAGLVLGYLLARSGIPVTVLEKHADFLRDFRGDTIHPSTLRALSELALLDDFLKLPHQQAGHVQAEVAGGIFNVASFGHLDPRWNFVAFMPQWDFLNFLAERASVFPHFRLLMQTAVVSLIEENGWVAGVHAIGPKGNIDIRAQLVIGCDGRHSTVRDACGLSPKQLGAPMDVLWFSLSRQESDGVDPVGKFEAGRVFIRINRGVQWQCGYVIAKGSLESIHAAGLDAFRASVAEASPVLADRVDEIIDWDYVKLLSVAVDRLERWHKPGVLLIGDAAHTMSPVGGVGINLAIQDAIAASNILSDPLRRGLVDESDLARVQKRREWPTRVTQKMQIIAQNNVIRPVLSGQSMQPPIFLRILNAIPWLQRIPAWMIGTGVRPEHVWTQELPPV